MHQKLSQWVDEIAAMTQPDRVVWCDGSQEEYDRLVGEMEARGELTKLNEEHYPNSFLARSDPQDVARVEHLTFICSDTEEEAGPTNNWMSPDEAETRVKPLYDGCMKGRTMYVVPFVMGPPGSAISEVGVEITDSPYVVVNMRIMTRVGQVALDQLGDDGDFDMFRRAKLMLDAIDSDVIDGAKASATLTARLGLSDECGMPRCAAVRPSCIAWTA